MLQTFRARDMRQALSATRVALGEDALILASEKTSDGGVVVCATVNGTESAPPPANLESFETRYRDNLIAHLRVRSGPMAQARAPFARGDLERQLDVHRVPRSLALQLAEDAEASTLPDLCLALSAALDKRMRMEAIDAGKEAVLLLAGPYGAGKTTVAAKLAAQARLLDRDVRLVATDVDSAGQRERLETFAAHLDVNLLAAATPALFADAAAEAHETGSFLIADSAGFDPRHTPPGILGFTGTQCAEIVGVVSAATDAEDAGEMTAALARLGAKRIVITGLDLAHRKGALVTIAASGIAIAHVTRSPYLAQGLDMLTPLELSRILLAPVDDQISET
jgi:flagellar biosynthesis protein FlhF